MQLVDSWSFDVHVHVAPGAHHWSTGDIVVGYVHTTSVSDATVDDHNLAVVARNDVVDPWKTYGIELHQFDTQTFNGVVTLVADGLVVGEVAKGIIHRTDLHTLTDFFCQEVEEQVGDGVVAEIEVFQMDERLGFSHCLEEVLELVVTTLEQADAVAVGESEASGSHFAGY